MGSLKQKNRAALAVLRPDVAAVAFDDGARDRKSQTRSLRLRGDECIKDAGHIVLGNAFPRIRHSHFNGARFWILTGPDRQMVRLASSMASMPFITRLMMACCPAALDAALPP